MVAPKRPNRSHTPKKGFSASQLPKKPAKANQSILSFFKKAEKTETSLFLGEAPATAETEDLYSADDADNSTRHNEADSPNKRRKLSQEPEQKIKPEASVKVEEVLVAKECPSPTKSDQEPQRKPTKPKIKTPFVDSDSEDESDDEAKAINNKSEKTGQ